MPKNSGPNPLRSVLGGKRAGRAEPSGSGGRITRIARNWRAAGCGDDFSNPAGLGALTCLQGLLDFEVSSTVAWCDRRRAVL